MHAHEQQKKEHALRISIKEGAANNAAVSLGDSYISLFALALKASPFAIGVISAIANLLAPLSQFVGSRSMERFSRKTITTRCALAETALWLPIAFLALLAWRGASQPLLLVLLVLGYALIVIVHGINYPPLFSWLGDIVPEQQRGVFFSRRNRVMELVGTPLLLLSGFVLDVFKTRGLAMLGFALLFALASIARFISYRFLQQQYEPRFKLGGRYYFSLLAFLRRMDNYGKFAMAYGLFNFAIMVASPFFVVYMRQELQLNYTYTILITISSSLFYLLFTPLVGRFSDRFGNRRLFYLAALLFALNPLLWIFLTNPWHLILLPQLIVGLANAALVIGVTNFTYDAVSQKHRALCVTYTNILSGIGAALGSLLGGLILSYVRLPFAKPFVVVFALAALLRLAIPLFFITQIREVKKVESLHAPHLNLMHPVKTLHSEIHWVTHILKEKKAAPQGDLARKTLR